MNKAILIGRLTRDPDLRYTSSGRAVCQFSIAINRTYTNQQGQREADYINCVVWDKQAENLAKFITKGRLIAVDGRIQTRNYDNNEGKKVYVTEVLANNIQFLESRNGASTEMESNPFDGMPEPARETPNTNESVSVDNDPFANFGESVEIDDNDLPF